VTIKGCPMCGTFQRPMRCAVGTDAQTTPRIRGGLRRTRGG
jgi:hypothetical protein